MLGLVMMLTRSLSMGASIGIIITMVMMIRTSGSGTSISGLGGLRLSGAGRGLTAS